MTILSDIDAEEPPRRGVPVKMLEAEIYFPDGTKAKIPGQKIAGHDPENKAVFEILDVDSGRQRLYLGFPYSIVVQPPGPEDEPRILVPGPGGRGIVGG